MLMYKLGVVGLGHWFEMLYIGIRKTKEIEIAKAASVSGLEKKATQLTRLGIPHDRYYKLDPSLPIPDKFFEELDMVHISNPNQFHAEQTLQSLEANKITITEKTFGINRDEFSRVMKFVKDNEMGSKAYLHLHYLHKTLVTQLPGMLKDITKKEGMITSSTATFFESMNEEGLRRSTWLFKPQSGGLFMDWIHPFEVYLRGAGADSFRLANVTRYAVNEQYDRENPTGIEADVAINGGFFAKDAKASIKISEGVAEEQKNRQVRLFFESGNYLDMHFVSHGTEYTTESRGRWELKDGKTGRVLSKGEPKGPNSSEVFVGDMVELCKGRNPGINSAEIELLYGPQWDYQERFSSAPLINGREEVDAFLGSSFG